MKKIILLLFVLASLINAQSTAIEITKTGSEYLKIGDGQKNRNESLDSYKKAIECFTKAIELDPKYANAYYLRGWAKTKFPKNDFIISSGSDADTALLLDPNNAEAYYFRGRIYDFEAIQSGSQSFEVFLSKRFTMQEEYYNKAIAINSKYTEAYTERARIRERLKNFNGVVDDCNKILEIDSMNFVGYRMRGSAKGELRDFNGALKDLNKAIEINPSDSWSISLLNDIKIELDNSTNKGKGSERSVENRRTIMNVLKTIGSIALQFHRKPHVLGGGEGSFMGFVLPMGLITKYTDTFNIAEIKDSTLTIVGIGNEIGRDGINYVKMTAVIENNKVKMSIDN